MNRQAATITLGWRTTLPALTGPHYLKEAPAFGKMTDVIPGLRWLRLPLPFARLNHLNVWILDEGDSWAVMDCGMITPETVALWNDLLAGPLATKKVRLLIATHCHGDHIGYARKFCALTGARFVATRAEWLGAVHRRVETSAGMRAEANEFYVRNGFPLLDLDTIYAERAAMGDRVDPPPESYQRIANGQELRFGGRDWIISTSGGHAPEHPIFRGTKLPLMIVGDQLLPGISPHIGVQMHEPLENPLGEYLDLLDRLQDTGDDVLVLPSHETPYYGLSRRIAMLRAHHQMRLEQIFDAARSGRNIYEIASIVFQRAVESGQIRHAFSETLAHVNYLVAQRLLDRETGRDGIHRYVPIRSLATPLPHVAVTTISGPDQPVRSAVSDVSN